MQEDVTGSPGEEHVGSSSKWLAAMICALPTCGQSTRRAVAINEPNRDKVPDAHRRSLFIDFSLVCNRDMLDNRVKRYNIFSTQDKIYIMYLLIISMI